MDKILKERYAIFLCMGKYEYLLQFVTFTIKTGHETFSQSMRIMIQMKPTQRGIAKRVWLNSERSQFIDVTSRKTKAQRQE